MICETTASELSMKKFLFLTRRTIATREALRLECGRVLKQGFGTDWGEADEGIHCVAGRMRKDRFSAVAVRVMKAAREIERRLRA